MKTRILWVPPAERNLKPGLVYDLPKEAVTDLIAKGEAEELAKGDKSEVLPDPRPKPEPLPAAVGEETQAGSATAEA